MVDCVTELSSQVLRLICLPVFLFAGLSAVGADDTPRPACAAVAPRLLEIYPDLNLASLTERERLNVSHYLRMRKGGENRSAIYVFRSRLPWEPEPNLTLIFPTRNCERSCIATAVLPRGDQFDLVDFSYRKNLIGEPSPGRAETINGFQERQSKSYIVMDVAERNFVAFFDFQRLPAGLPWNPETLKQAQSVRSGTSTLRSRDRPKNYGACFKNLFEVEGFIP
jgi:hypothetical protein